MATIGNRFGILDRAAIVLSALCLVHCVATTLLIGALVTASTFLESPLIHETGLVLAMLLGVVALGVGVARHGRWLPLAVGAIGLALMGTALTLDHGIGEALVTMAGVSILACGHLLNRRFGRRTHSH